MRCGGTHTAHKQIKYKRRKKNIVCFVWLLLSLTIDNLLQALLLLLSNTVV